jgi:putative flippase GtrA
VKAETATRLRFGLVGVGNTLVDLIGYTVLVTAGMPMVVANLISTSAGMVLSFTLNRNFTFRAKSGDARLQLLLFFLVTATGLWVMQPVVIALCTGMFSGLGGTPAVVAPKLVALAVGLVWNYILYSKLVFRTKRPAVAEVSPDGISAEGIRQ